MKYRKLLHFLQNIGKDPETLIFEDKLTRFANRRRLFQFFDSEIEERNLRQWPLSLLMIGIDDLKRINSQYGLHVGDEALLHIAGIMKALATEKDLLVRYGAGEFMMLLPGKSKQESLKIAESLVAAFQENPFFSSEAGMLIPVSIAIGTACAPDDGDYGKILINRADTALYHARKTGDGSIVDAADAGRHAIRHIHSAGIVGRKTQFDAVSGGFKDLAKGRNQFFIIDGEPGMGKTSFIDAVKRNLEKTRLRPIRVSGSFQESFRPYYLISYIIIALMNRRKDKGVEIIESTDKEDLACLLQVIPQLTDEKLQAVPGDYPGKPPAVFNAINRFLSKLAENQTLVLLIDDFDLADPASLDILRELMVSGGSALFICAAAHMGDKDRSTAIPLALFRTAYSEKLEIKSVFLNPLTPADVKKYINLIFPGIALPEGISEEIDRITDGYPLFLVAIIIKMIEDRKILQSENRWTVAELENGYFPGSFEHIIREKLDNLDSRNKAFIDRVSAFGESASLSMLEGFTKQESYQVYEIIKEAVDHGLMRHEFIENDENIRFTNKFVRELIYERIGEEERKKLHEEIGLYHEKLYFQDVLPSAAPLVHHFKQSENHKKTNTYEELMARYNTAVYKEKTDAEEDAADEEEAGREYEVAVKPLSAKGLQIIPEMLHTLVVSIRNFRLYPEKSKSVTSMTGRLMYLVQEILKTDDCFSIIVEKNLLLVNSHPADSASMPAVTAKIIELFNRLELKSLTIKRGITKKELIPVVRHISSIGSKAVTPKFWKRFSKDNALVHIVPVQVRYAKVGPGHRLTDPITGGMPIDNIEPIDIFSGHPFKAEEITAIQLIVGALLSAFNKIKLYPSQGHVATKAVFQVVTRLHAFLETWPIFSISRIDDRLLVNGIKIDTRAFEILADGLLKLLRGTGLNSISFTRGVSGNEIVEFIKAACRMPADAEDPDFWQKLAARKQINGILFNQNIYDIIPAKEDEASAPAEEDRSGPAREDAIDKFHLDDLPARARDLYLKGDIRRLETVLLKVLDMYLASDTGYRLRVTAIFHRLLFPEDWRPNADYIKLVLKHAVTLLEIEEAAGPQKKWLNLAHECITTLIRLGEYTLAAWIYTRAEARFAALQPESGVNAGISGDSEDVVILGKPLPPGTTEAINEDLQSEDRHRQQEAIQLLSSMGDRMTPFLVDVVLESSSLRIRRLAAELISRHGRPGAERLKKALANAWRPEQKSRIIDVIDIVTIDLADEMANIFSDPDDQIRRSAFKLVERLNTPEALSLTDNAARSDDARLALPAIHTLVKLKPDFLARTLTAILKASNNNEILIACSRAMGQTGSAVYIEPLSEILFPKRRFFRRKKYNAPVRVAAAFAMAQLPWEKAGSMMKRLKKDPDERIRQVVNRYDSD